MTTFKEKESSCQRLFDSGGPYWHLYTLGKETPLIFNDTEDYAYAMNVLAQTAAEYQEMKIIAFEIMGNHLHILASGSQECLLDAFAFLRKRIARGLKSRYPDGLPSKFSPKLKVVDGLEAMRNTIVYINRNGFVANSHCTPYSYPWGTGCDYFGQTTHPTLRYGDVSERQHRKLFRGRVPNISEDWPMSANDYILPVAYCHINFGMSMFRDAHHYFSLLCKNVEAFAELAVELDDGEFLTDSEVFSQLNIILRTDYSGRSLKEITSPQKYDLARLLRLRFRSSNGQIRRVLSLNRYEVDSLFPPTMQQ